MSIFELGNVKWTNQDMIDRLPEFSNLWKDRIIKNNEGGMRSPQMFYSWFGLQQYKPKIIIESGIWRGLGTYFFEKACPDANIISIDIDYSNRIYKSSKAVYLDKDFTTYDWKTKLAGYGPRDVVFFFDDHVTMVERINIVLDAGYKITFWEDNYMLNTGIGRGGSIPCYSPKQSVDSQDEFYQSVLSKNMSLYYEFPPIFAVGQMREGLREDARIMGVATPTWKDAKPPLLTQVSREEYQCFYDEVDDCTWYGIVEFK